MEVVLELDEREIVRMDIKAVECVLTNKVLLHSSRQTGSIGQQKREKK